MTDDEIINDGWGGLKRIKFLNEHFEQLKQLKHNDYCLKIGIHCYSYLSELKLLFERINININQWFDIILTHDNNICNKIYENEKYTKQKCIKMVCQNENVSTNNVLYIDDDPNIDQQIKCCKLFKTQTRRGINNNEMYQIYQEISKMMICMDYGVCMDCGNQWNISEMKYINQMYFCIKCYNTQIQSY